MWDIGDPGPVGPGKLALLLNSEISAVITAMRANAKWAVVPRYNVSRPTPRGAGSRWKWANLSVCRSRMPLR